MIFVKKFFFDAEAAPLDLNGPVFFFFSRTVNVCLGRLTARLTRRFRSFNNEPFRWIALKYKIYKITWVFIEI